MAGLAGYVLFVVFSGLLVIPRGMTLVTLFAGGVVPFHKILFIFYLLKRLKLAPCPEIYVIGGEFLVALDAGSAPHVNLGFSCNVEVPEIAGIYSVPYIQSSQVLPELNGVLWMNKPVIHV